MKTDHPAPPNPKQTEPGTLTEAGLAVATSGPKWLVGLLLAAGLLIGAFHLLPGDWLRQALAAVEQAGTAGPILFIAVYAVAAVGFVPGSVLTLGAGALFGVVWGSLYASMGSTLGATAAFLVGRYLARDIIARKLQHHRRFVQLNEAVAQEGWKVVGLTRLSPVLPYTLLNYAFGLTQVKLRDYVLASWIGMMPGTLMYVYLGSLAKAASGERTRTTGEWVLYGVGLLATVAVTLFVTRIAKQALAKKIA